MPDILTLLLGTFALYILLYGVCWPRNEKVYWLIYIIIITESVAFILVWISYFLNAVSLYKILIDLYIRIYLSGMVILGVIILKRRIKDFISGKSR